MKTSLIYVPVCFSAYVRDGSNECPKVKQLVIYVVVIFMQHINKQQLSCVPSEIVFHCVTSPNMLRRCIDFTKALATG